MALFRKRIGLADARAKLLAIVIGSPEKDADLARSYPQAVSSTAVITELLTVRLFGVLVACKETHHGDWRGAGRELFESIQEPVVAALAAVREEPPVLVERALGDQLQYYGLAAGVISEPSMDALGREVGESFRMVLREEPDDALSRLGRGTFFMALDRTIAFQNDHKLAQGYA